MTPAQKSELKGLGEKASSGRWYQYKAIEVMTEPHGHKVCECARVGDAAYIAAASPDRILELLGEVQKAHDDYEALKLATANKIDRIRQNLGFSVGVPLEEACKRLGDTHGRVCVEKRDLKDENDLLRAKVEVARVALGEIQKETFDNKAIRIASGALLEIAGSTPGNVAITCDRSSEGD